MPTYAELIDKPGALDLATSIVERRRATNGPALRPKTLVPNLSRSISTLLLGVIGWF